MSVYIILTKVPTRDALIYSSGLCVVTAGKDLHLTHAVIDRRQSAGGELSWRT